MPDASAAPPTTGHAHHADHRARTLWMAVGGGIGLLASTPFAVLAVAGAVVPLALPVAVLGIAAGGWYGRAVWRRRTWELGEASLELRHGVLVHRASTIPYRRIQQIDVERGPLERMLGLSQVIVRTAAATTDGTLYGLLPEDAATIRARLLAVAGIDDGV